MRKYVSILIILAICLSFSACAKNESNTITASSETGNVLSSEASSLPQSAGSSETSDGQNSTVSSTSASSSRPVSKAPAQSTASGSTQSTSPSSRPATAKTVRVVIPEGFTLSQIGDRLEANGVCKKKDLLSTANSFDFSYYSLIGKLDLSAKRCYKLEGYLFPDTYEFYTGMKPQDALGKMLKNAESKIGSNYSYSGMSTDQVVALASIIEKEASGAAEMKKISSVFHNRLNAGMRLQADPTIIYIEKYVKPNLSGDINRYNSYYNTYKASALPAGAICNPGKAALNAAANPDNTDYLYFAADKAGNYYYAKTLDEHKANLAKGGIIEGGSMQ